jgi:hypothetical protein
MSMKKFIPISLAVVIIIATALALIFLFPNSKIFYRRYDLNKESYLLWLDSRGIFNQELEKSRLKKELWTENPREIALRLAGYPNIDNASPDKVDVFQNDEKTVTVIVFDDNLQDDARSAEEVRVDLAEKDGKWQIQWAGGRWKCRRAFYTGWTTSGCS